MLSKAQRRKLETQHNQARAKKDREYRQKRNELQLHARTSQPMNLTAAKLKWELIMHIDDQALRAEIAQRIDELLRAESDTCPKCLKRVQRLEQMGRRVIARPCGCFIAQGTVHPNWRVVKKVK